MPFQNDLIIPFKKGRRKNLKERTKSFQRMRTEPVLQSGKYGIRQPSPISSAFHMLMQDRMCTRLEETGLGKADRCNTRESVAKQQAIRGEDNG